MVAVRKSIPSSRLEVIREDLEYTGQIGA